jgi:protein tyrosine phosphatase (PTP) superfamily phosphohydrolase (DUF442 family)
MKNTTNNPIAQIASTLAGNAKAKQDKKPSKVIATLGDSATLECVTMYAQGIKAGDDAVQMLNDAIAPFHKAKVKLCKASEKSSPLYAYSSKVRTMFIDSCLAIGKTKSYTEKMLYPAFLRAVNSGKEVSQINASQEKAKAKGGKGKQVAGIDAMIAKLISHEGFNTLPDNLQYEIRDYLESEGYEITE